ncbi:hypothetical protein [Bradyrhizobium sp. 45]|uniref:hypothetical protein n=1 Tax=Bradyrhizobium sp. 45 TaxID=1043587 RepID=UPI001FF8E051|nr:hypothetical protein [Bradyrhizobium sp. 45]MCK1307631.1 hypothetical protein [Bradyrhizobium sp. 45]
MQEGTVQVALTMLVLGLAGFVYVVGYDVSLNHYIKRVKRKDGQFWNHHYLVDHLNREIIAELKADTESSAEVYDAPVHPPKSLWRRARSQGEEGYAQ